MDIIILILAGFLGGSVNAAAGGGTFFTLPALIMVGAPPIIANATGTLALLPGYISSLFGFREDLSVNESISLRLVLIASAVGGGLGAALLIITPGVVFKAIIPWLTLASTCWFALWPLIRKRITNYKDPTTLASFVIVTLVCVYGGYFNGGMGIILLAMYGAMGVSNLRVANGLKNLTSAMLTIIAVIVYVVGGAVWWKYAFVMMVSSAVGGYVGARIARSIPEFYMRAFIVFVGFTITVIFFYVI